MKNFLLLIVLVFASLCFAEATSTPVEAPASKLDNILLFVGGGIVVLVALFDQILLKTKLKSNNIVQLIYNILKTIGGLLKK